MQNKKDNKVISMPTAAPTEQIIQYPELFTEDEVINLGEVISKTEIGCIFVLKDDTITMYQPVARKHFKENEFYYSKVEFR